MIELGTFDVIVVGGGAAGCILAARLSEAPNRSVLLLEAGPDYPDGRPESLRIPRPLMDPGFTWTYDGILTTEQPDPARVVRGRVIGGSGAINGSSFMRGIRADYEAWGSERWSWPRVLDAFRRAETDADFGGEHHGDSGPMPATRTRREAWGPVDAAFFEAALAWGFPEQPDLNEPERIGIGANIRNVRDGRRVDTSVAYLDPARGRPNLTILGDAPARRVLFHGTTVAGVELERRGEVACAYAGAVVLSAGGIGTPHMLFCSGVGPGDRLRELGLPVVVDLPGVGGNLADHPMLNTQLLPAEGAIPTENTEMAPVGIFFTGEGSPFESDLRITVTAAPASPWEPAYVTLTTLLSRGVSKGRLHFSSADPAVLPTIEYRYFDDPFDRRRGREVLRIAAELVRMEPLASMVKGVDGITEEELGSDEALDRWILANAATTYHSVGTCKLGSPDDSSSVVDDRCRVLGVEGLYVADLSIVPDVPRGGTFGTAVMIGERASELIGEAI